MRYFHTKESLDSIHYLADGNLLRLSSETRCALASYESAEGATPPTLLLIAYATADEARGAFDAFRRRYLEAEDEGSGAAALLEDGAATAAAWRESPPSVALALGAESKDRALGMARTLLDAYKERSP
jgi:hypothetical protein